jgi:hypothetical protein
MFAVDGRQQRYARARSDMGDKSEKVYLVSTSKPLQSAIVRATLASGHEITTVENVLELPANDPSVKALVVEPNAIVTPEQKAFLERLCSVYNTLILNEEEEKEGKIDPTVVDLLKKDLCNHAIKVDRMNLQQLVITMNKLLSGDIFGIEKYLPWGVPIQTLTFSAYEAKRDATDAITLYLKQLGCRRPLIARIENAVEELLMNALYDAAVPVKEERPEFVASVVTGKQAAPVTVRYASSGNEFVLAVRDEFGRLKKGTMVERMGTPTSGVGSRTGAGLYVLFSKATRVIVNVAPNACTEVISFFDLDWPAATNQQGVQTFSYFEKPEKPKD